MSAERALRVEESGSGLYQDVGYRSRNQPAERRYASLAKTLCSDAAMAGATDSVQLHGCDGYLKDYPIERMMRDAKVTQIWEGTNQIQRLIIAKETYANR